MFRRKILSVNEIISQLEDDDDFLAADIYITPPDGDKSDEDSGDEDSGNINCSRTSGKYMSSPPPLSKKKRADVTRKWRSVDISEEPEREEYPPDFLEDVENPVQFFEMFYDDKVIELLRSETEKNANHKGKHGFKVTKVEIRHLLRVFLLSGYNSVARYRMYWEQTLDCNFLGSHFSCLEIDLGIEIGQYVLAMATLSTANFIKEPVPEIPTLSLMNVLKILFKRFVFMIRHNDQRASVSMWAAHSAMHILSGSCEHKIPITIKVIGTTALAAGLSVTLALMENAAAYNKKIDRATAEKYDKPIADLRAVIGYLKKSE
ncbi:PiggyBac transposable element-derived protein 3 [Eumeta japonica]|uniref:PiggyBac transposable element-derived protein 3 n=1 Tax=Eumeta variegata TaxID=151549 RepID=A0A4C1TUP1_EUMVA|nr:PiggyBac transposable element-derived protein 3 [Eumeta japonica]